MTYLSINNLLFPYRALSVGHHKGYAVYSLLNVLETPVLQYENEGLSIIPKLLFLV